MQTADQTMKMAQATCAQHGQILPTALHGYLRTWQRENLDLGLAFELLQPLLAAGRPWEGVDQQLRNRNKKLQEEADQRLKASCTPWPPEKRYEARQTLGQRVESDNWEAITDE
jgi:hypothetical protein